MGRSWKYTKERLEAIIPECESWADVCRGLGASVHGGSQAHAKKVAKGFGIDFSHFRSGRGSWHKGRTSPRRRSADDILVKRESGGREKAYRLRRALIEIGREYACSSCGIRDWRGIEIVLEVDHVDGDCLNNRPENVRFLCPNCHSQTGNYRSRNRK